MTTVAAGLFIQGSRVLIARRAPGQTLAGFWEFPGGKQESGETILECLEREIREEFGVGCRAKEVLAQTIYEYPQGTIALVGVVAEFTGGDIALTVHDECRWVSIDELDAYMLAPADIVLAAVLRKKGR